MAGFLAIASKVLTRRFLGQRTRLKAEREQARLETCERV
ncbi:hypothetical protein BLL69_1915c [Lacticaseibacillus paracasei]|nr:hypothetical protein BLL69_1915c [Lacticaseibacillus paracasei]